LYILAETPVAAVCNNSPMAASSSRYDIAVIGGGIVGLATAMRLAEQHPRYRVAVIEKEQRIAAHQSSHNSGVIHSGIYYAPGSLKAQNCVAGARELMAFCDANGIEYDLCGKVIVATEEEELPRLDALYQRGLANGVPGLELIDAARLRDLEPASAGIRALYSPKTGIIDYAEVAAAYAAHLEKAGGEVLLDARVLAIGQRPSSVLLETARGEVEATHVINCAGLYSDTVARMMGLRPGLRIIPFRGEYYMLKPEAHGLVRGLIYPVPDPQFPFLGVHFTRTIHGGVEAGPNAVLALAREGYTKTSVNLTETAGALAFPGFWRMAHRYWKTGAAEVYRSLSKPAFTKALQRYVPAIRAEHLDRGGAGVRAQAVDASGRLVDDFRIVEAKNAIHVLNAPSPGATASLAISANIVAMAEKSFDLT
jgi:L-2-hydroxyglutarate oxidase LhgO